jgi:hypothetical protein
MLIPIIMLVVIIILIDFNQETFWSARVWCGLAFPGLVRVAESGVVVDVVAHVQIVLAHHVLLLLSV